MREKVIETILKEKIIVIVRGVESGKLIPLAEAMYDGGIRLLEITYGGNDSQTAQNIEMLRRHFDGKMHIGAGTVTTPARASLTKNAGGEFIISPNTDHETIKLTRELDMVSIPGALTPSEIVTADRAGADFVKLFPVTGLGAKYLKAVKAPLSNIRFLAVGGIDENNMGEYFSAGACGFGIGSNIINKTALKEENYNIITETAKKYVSAAAEACK